GAVLAWIVPDGASADTPFHVFGAHSDSPALKLKPQPTTGRAGWLQAGVEIYGGPLLNSWLDRELRLAGRLVLDDGSSVLAATGALLRLPQLAIHLDREANDHLALNKQTQTQPVWGLSSALASTGGAAFADLLGEVAAAAGVDAARIRGYDLVTADAARGAVFGQDDVFFASGRLDDLASVHAGLVAFEKAGTDAAHISVLAVFDHEEVGSATRSGAAGPFLADVIEHQDICCTFCCQGLPRCSPLHASFVQSLADVAGAARRIELAPQVCQRFHRSAGCEMRCHARGYVAHVAVEGRDVDFHGRHAAALALETRFRHGNVLPDRERRFGLGWRRHFRKRDAGHHAGPSLHQGCERFACCRARGFRLAQVAFDALAAHHSRFGVAPCRAQFVQSGLGFAIEYVGGQCPVRRAACAFEKGTRCGFAGIEACGQRGDADA
ncbi:MAG: hypothetical protein J0H32_13400, partial [Rhizobiales bacterium]|nr:hypothetical protein [Hyphomicrobiales bacterium]